MFNDKHITGCSAYGRALVGAMPNKPNDATTSIADNKLATFLQDGKLQVGQIVAHQAGALHTERLKTIA